MEDNDVINDRYEIDTILGKGGYGQVLKVYDNQKKKYFALKKDIQNKGNVYQESTVLKNLQGGEGIPKLYDIGKTSEFTYMVIELLGESLSALMKKVGSKNIDLVTIILIQALSRIEYIHSKGYIHRDIKPQQFLIGSHNILYLVDYGISKKYIVDGHHLNFQSECPRIGSSSYASINAHSGIRLSRRDDLESFMYMAIFLLKGSLPWTQYKGLNENYRWNNVFLLKRDIKDNQLFLDCPKEFQLMMHYIKGLKFEENPDYHYLKELINNIRDNLNLSAQCQRLNFIMKKRNTVIIEKMPRSLEIIESPKRKRGKSKSMVPIKKKLDVGNLQIPINEFQKTISTCLGSFVKSKSNSPSEETQKAFVPGFADRKNIFKIFNEFRKNINNQV